MSKQPRPMQSDANRAFQQLLRDNATTLAGVQEISPDNMALFYRIGYEAYQAGDFGRAQAVFNFLCQFGHVEAKHWFGLGATLQKLHRFDAGAIAYATASVMAGGDPTALLHAADCWLSTGDRDTAQDLLEQAVALSDGHPEQEGTRERALGLLQLLRQQS